MSSSLCPLFYKVFPQTLKLKFLFYLIFQNNILQHLMYTVTNFSFLKKNPCLRICLLILEREAGKEREGERQRERGTWM